MAEADLTRVVLCRGAAELVDELVSGDRTVAELRRTFPRRVLGPALRVLAAEGALRRSAAGSWDRRPGRRTRVSLTDSGHRIAAALSDPDVWVAAYERHLGRRTA